MYLHCIDIHKIQYSNIRLSKNNYILDKDADYFPKELHKYGCSKKALTEVFMHLKDGEKGEAPWKIQGIPNVDFYQHLYQYLKRWSLTKSATKTLLGQLYTAIDPSLEAKHSRPDNIYRFIEKFAGS